MEMNMTVKKLLALAGFFLVLAALEAQETGNPGLKTILNNYGERNYLPGPVARADLDLILQAGARAPSAMNRQPWRFTVVQNRELAGKIISGAVDGNVLVVISAEDSRNPRVTLDCALAAENIYLAAQALGYGSRIYTGPVDDINRNLKSDLSLPRGHDAVIVVRLGRIEPKDALSAASSRKSLGDTVTYK
jgi:nitroreductase